MPKSFRSFAERMLNPFLSFQEMRYAVIIAAFSVIPSIAMFIVLQLYLSDAAVTMMCRGHHSLSSHDFAPLFNYYTIWVAHVLISVGVGVGADRSAFRNASEVKIKALKRFRIAIFLSLMLIVFVADATHRNIALLSHERIFNVLSNDPALAVMFHNDVRYLNRTIPMPTSFSFLPIVAVAAALWAMATVILCCSRFLAAFQQSDGDSDTSSGDRVAAFSDAMEALRSHFLALSLVLVTSTLATIAFFRTPLGLLGSSERRDYQNISDAMGLVWGVTFSLTLIALCVYPFVVLRRRFDSLDRDAQDTKNAALGRWIRKHRTLLQVPANLKLVLSILSPATVAIVSRLISI
ncbi:MAG TPA: hypothetical protein VJZ76_11760 [Thermoanaerobaculia bacterium]|nr:hypothetical protein [Thermoanaerobaculia bacterium]